MGESVGEETTNRYFDELASGLASGSISRGKALTNYLKTLTIGYHHV
jgi:hypothetical protein